APGTTVRLAVEEAEGAKELVIVVEAGALQVDLADKGGFRDVSVRSRGLEVRVLGTLLVVECVRKDDAYVALVHGRVQARVRSLAAAGQAAAAWMTLVSRQGLLCSGSGLGSVEGLTMRPQLDLPAATRPSVQSQGLHAAPPTTPDDARSASAAAITGTIGVTGTAADREWHQDEATDLILTNLYAIDPSAALKLAIDITRQDPITGGEAVAAVVTQSPENAARFVAAVITAVPSATAEIVGDAVAAAPMQSGDIVSAAITAVPSSTGLIVASSVTNVPEATSDIVAAAVIAAPTQVITVVSAASAANPGAVSDITVMAENLSSENTAAIAAAGVRGVEASKSDAPSSAVTGVDTPPTIAPTPVVVVAPEPVIGSVEPSLVVDNLVFESLNPLEFAPIALPADTSPTSVPISPE
ncbi:MAG: hypothetical protein H0W83_15595, partial [Planctomycetes bacterium]|nr:hypothetical protein [Planctomycetota bacterium]